MVVYISTFTFFGKGYLFLPVFVVTNVAVQNVKWCHLIMATLWNAESIPPNNLLSGYLFIG